MESHESVWRRVAARQHGAVSHAQIAAAGLSGRQVELRVQAGVLEPMFRGVYRVGGTPTSFEERTMAACLATNGVASHRAAAALWGLRGCEPGLLDVTVAGRRAPALGGVTGHTTRRLTAIDSARRDGVPLTTPARTLLDLGAVVPPAAVESALEDALHRQLVTRPWLDRVLQRTGAPGRDGTAVLRSLLRERGDAPATESALEDAIVRLLRRAGLPAPARQHWVSVPGEPPVRIDLCYPEARLAIEAQSLRWHGGRLSLQADCRKQNLLVRLGWRLLVFTWEDAHRRSAQLVRSVGRLLSGGETTRGAEATSDVVPAPESSDSPGRPAGLRYLGP